MAAQGDVALPIADVQALGANAAIVLLGDRVASQHEEVMREIRQIAGDVSDLKREVAQAKNDIARMTGFLGKVAMVAGALGAGGGLVFGWLSGHWQQALAWIRKG